MTIDRRISMMVCCVMLLTVCGGRALHASCIFPLQGEGRVSAILDARTLRLDDGRDVRLAGVELPEEIATRSTDTLTSLIGGREITLHGPDDRPDRYGRQPAFVFPKGSGVSIQSELLARGEALASGTLADKACSTALFAAEATARAARRGIWTGSAALKNAERADDILAGTGRFAVVEGTISSARLAGATFYVNFGRRWTLGLCRDYFKAHDAIFRDRRDRSQVPEGQESSGPGLDREAWRTPDRAIASGADRGDCGGRSDLEGWLGRQGHCAEG